MDLRIRTQWIDTWNNGWAFLPIVAGITGAWAFAAPLTEAQWTDLALIVALVLAGWRPFWHALTAVDWATPLRRWQAWQESAPLPRWPYLQPTAPGARVRRAWGQARAWWAAEGAELLAAPVRSAALSAIVSLLLSAVLGRTVLLLTLLFLTWTELAALWNDGRGIARGLWSGVALGGLPWLLGATLNGALTTDAALSTLVVILLASTFPLPSLWTLVGPGAATLFLVMQEAFVTGGLILLLAFPGWLLLSQGVDDEAYRRASVLWLLLMLLLLAGAL
jgi:hypothetical protein